MEDVKIIVCLQCWLKPTPNKKWFKSNHYGSSTEKYNFLRKTNLTASPKIVIFNWDGNAINEYIQQLRTQKYGISKYSLVLGIDEHIIFFEEA